LEFHHDAIRDWCLGLCLLTEELIHDFTVSELDGTGTRVKFQVDSGDRAKTRITCNAQSSKVVITKNNLDYLRNFFLKYYRDGVAEVDHLDLEADDDQNEDSKIYITFKVPDSRTPMTPGEAKRRLDRWS
jgi:hypothetical protein